jgi:hypothetical protein
VEKQALTQIMVPILQISPQKTMLQMKKNLIKLLETDPSLFALKIKKAKLHLLQSAKTMTTITSTTKRVLPASNSLLSAEESSVDSKAPNNFATQ